ncbi:MAG: hypothetical protein ACRC6D_13965 [Aeromonas sp.]
MKAGGGIQIGTLIKAAVQNGYDNTENQERQIRNMFEVLPPANDEPMIAQSKPKRNPFPFTRGYEGYDKEMN